MTKPNDKPVSKAVISYALPHRFLIDLFPSLTGNDAGRAEVVDFKKGTLTLDLNNGVTIKAKDVSILDAKAGKLIETGAKLHFSNTGEVVSVTATDVKKIETKPQARTGNGSNTRPQKSMY